MYQTETDGKLSIKQILLAHRAGRQTHTTCNEFKAILKFYDLFTTWFH